MQDNEIDSTEFLYWHNLINPSFSGKLYGASNLRNWKKEWQNKQNKCLTNPKTAPDAPTAGASLNP